MKKGLLVVVFLGLWVLWIWNVEKKAEPVAEQPPVHTETMVGAVDPQRDVQALTVDVTGALRVTFVPEGGVPVTVTNATGVQHVVVIREGFHEVCKSEIGYATICWEEADTSEPVLHIDCPFGCQ